MTPIMILKINSKYLTTLINKAMKGIPPKYDLPNELSELNYDSTKSVTLDEMFETVAKLNDLPRPKPEYVLTRDQAESLPLWWLLWLCKNNTVLGNLETSQILKKRCESENIKYDEPKENTDLSRMW